jgi:hypothetical protein
VAAGGKDLPPRPFVGDLFGSSGVDNRAICRTGACKWASEWTFPLVGTALAQLYPEEQTNV